MLFSEYHKMNIQKVFVLVDMDGVLADFDKGFLHHFQQFYPNMPFIPLDERNTVYIEEQYEEKYGISIDVCDIIEMKNFFSGLPVIDNALEGIRSLASRSDVEMFICTSPLRKFHNCVSEKYLWVSDKLGPKFTDRIILTRDKTIVNGHFLIDDKPEIKGTQNPSWKHLLFTTHHNRHIFPREDQVKLTGWDDETLHKLIDEKFKELNS